MEIIKTNIKDLKQIKFTKQAVASIGFFDGMHKYHQKILSKANKISKKQNLDFIVIVFSKNIKDYFNGNDTSITTTDQKSKFIEKKYLNASKFIEIETNEDLVNTTKKEFIKILDQQLMVVKLVEGEDFKFGAKASGNIEDLQKAFGKENVIVQKRHNKISSSNIRKLLKENKKKEANKILGIKLVDNN